MAEAATEDYNTFPQYLTDYLINNKGGSPAPIAIREGDRYAIPASSIADVVASTWKLLRLLSRGLWVVFGAFMCTFWCSSFQIPEKVVGCGVIGRRMALDTTI
jgi:hypothetical protein